MGNNFFKYLNIGEVEQKWGIYATTAGYSKVAPNEFYPNEVHPKSHELTWNKGRVLSDYYFVYISKGQGLFCSARNGPVVIEEGTGFFLFPGTWHRYKPYEQSGWEEYWVGCHGYYIDELMRNNFFSPADPCINIGLNEELLSLFKKLIDTVRSSFIGYQQQAAGMILQIFGLVNTIKQSSKPSLSAVEKCIMKSRFLLQESLERPVDIEEIAAQVCMGYSLFRKKFKEHTGQTPYQYHLNLRIERACELLESTLLNVEEVADQTGFESIYYFSRIFKKKMGQSPAFYRKKNIQDIRRLQQV